MRKSEKRFANVNSKERKCGQRRVAKETVSLQGPPRAFSLHRICSPLVLIALCLSLHHNADDSQSKERQSVLDELDEIEDSIREGRGGGGGAGGNGWRREGWGGDGKTESLAEVKLLRRTVQT